MIKKNNENICNHGIANLRRFISLFKKKNLNRMKKENI